VRDLAKLDRPIEQLVAVEGGLLAVVAGGGTDLVTTRGAVVPAVLPPMLAGPIASPTGREVVAVGTAGQLTVVDLPGVARWTLPVRYAPNQDVFGFAPDGRLFQASDRAVLVWTLPDPGADLAAWIDEQTNAIATGDGVLVWPWQAGQAPSPAR